MFQLNEEKHSDEIVKNVKEVWMQLQYYGQAFWYMAWKYWRLMSIIIVKSLKINKNLQYFYNIFNNKYSNEFIYSTNIYDY